MEHYVQETNKLKRAWIRFWYNDITRVFLVMFPGHFLFTWPVLQYLGASGEVIKNFAILSYMVVFLLGMIDNDYTNLYRIGRDVNGRPLKRSP